MNTQKRNIIYKASIFLIVMGVFLFGSAKNTLAGPISTLDMQSDAGDYIGQGKAYSYPLVNMNVTVNTLDLDSNGKADRITFSITPKVSSGTDFWTVSFATDKVGKNLDPGVYSNAQRASFAMPGYSGLDVSGQGRGSNTLTGNFTILEAKFDYSVPNSPKLISFAATFEQHSEGSAPALRGAIYYNYTLQPSLEMQSDAGDYVGQGKNYMYSFTQRQVIINMLEMNKKGVDRISFYMTDNNPTTDDVWSVDFSTDQLGTVLKPGVYLNAQRSAFAASGHPGLDVYGQGRGSNTLTGSFTITEANFDYTVPTSPKLISFAATFEQHSEGSAPALKGSIYWNTDDFSPVIVTQPSNVTTTAGSTATFSVVAIGTPAPTYQWMSSVNGGPFTAMAGQTNASRTTGILTKSNSGNKYECVVTNRAGSVTSNVVTLTVK